MPRRALRSYPTKDATDLTDEQWAALAPLVVTPSSKGGRPTDIRSPRDRQRTALQTSHRLPMAHASERCSANEFGSILF